MALVPTVIQFLDPLGEDIDALEREMAAADSSGKRRQYVRAVFALVEATLTVLKASCLGHWRADRIVLDGPEVVMLLEQSYDLTTEGEVRARRAHLPLKANLRFAFQVTARAFSVSYSFPAGDVGFEEFQRAIRVRDRLTHPKTLGDLEVSSSELTEVRSAFRWYMSTSADLIRGLAGRLEEMENMNQMSESPDDS